MASAAFPWIAGVDGCRTGWVAAFARADRPGEAVVSVHPTLAAILDGPEQPAVVAVDIPIGLPDRILGPGRGPDQAVRPFLGGRQSSVFSMPSRGAVYAADYAGACALALETSDPPRKVSKQGFMLFPKVREVDALLRARPDVRTRVFEVHPEVAFWAMNGDAALPLPKKVKGAPHPPGLDLWRALLRRAGIAGDVLAAAPPRGAGPDDLLDALAALVVARAILERRARVFPDSPPRDAHGLTVAIWTCGPSPAYPT